MRYRKLRIAWSVVWGVVAVLLIVLWARSYWWYEHMELSPGLIGISLSSGRGNAIYGIWIESSLPPTHWFYVWHPVIPGGLYYGKNFFEFLYMLGESIPHRIYLGPQGLTAPCWLSASLATLFAAVPWLFLRFSLRTLLIATTLVAVVLGGIVWAVQ